MELTLQPKIFVAYKNSSCRLGLIIMLSLAPFWLVWIPWVCSWVGAAVWDDLIFRGAPDASLVALLLFFIGLFAVSSLTMFVCLQNRFVVTNEGVAFPLRCLLELGFKLNRKWSELDSLQFTKEGKVSTDPVQMVWCFGMSNLLPLELAAFTKEDLQKLLMAVEAYNPQLLVVPAFSQVQLGIATGKTLSASGVSFTKIWEDDLASRFGSTVFVPLEPGDQLQEGGLQVLGQIAFGGLSAIYLAKRKTGDVCVIKEAVVPASADEASKEKALELFQREAQLLMGLTHPRVARVMDHFVEQGRHYLLLEHIDGKDLRRFVKEHGGQKEEMVMRWAREILEVLVYLHELDPPIVHRDLTPDNLVLEKDGSVTLIDFGAANEFLGTATGTLVGKQSYIPPEQFRGKAVPQSDLYSLGATLQFLLTGEDPEPLSQSHPSEKDSRISEAVGEFVACLTAMELAERYSTANDALSACKNLIDNKKRGQSLKVDHQVLRG